ncbi:MAG: glycerate kinase [Proteobacteria bacterium]|nr:glycerate kinase [Pseudomonadota bacterium]
MKIVLAPNAFKDSLSAIRAAEVMAEGVRRALPEADIRTVPVADGGDGLTEIVLQAMGGRKMECRVHDPLGRDIESAFCYVPEKRLAVIEMANASGLRLLAPSERNPMSTSTLGTGELIRQAMDQGAEKILVGIGGSATCDGGIGMAGALGVRFLDERSETIDPVGGNLGRIRRIDPSGLDGRAKDISFEAICDVNNPLLGEQGAAAVYGPQKGASPEQVYELEQGLANLADRVEAVYGEKVRHLDFGGAAGGLGMGLYAFLQAELRPGVDVVLDLVELDKALENADLAITGEGRLDEQSAFGKAPTGVAMRSKKRGVPCFAIAGSLGGNLSSIYSHGFNALFSICPGPIPLEQAMKDAASYLEKATEQAIRAFLAGKISNT